MIRFGLITSVTPLEVQLDNTTGNVPITAIAAPNPAALKASLVAGATRVAVQERPLEGRKVQLVLVGEVAAGTVAAAPTPIRAEARRATGSTTLAAGAWTTYPLDTVVSAGGGSWSPSKWTCPRAGTYLVVGSVRLADTATSRSVGVGVGTASADGPSVLWGDMGGARSGRQVSRVMDLAVGDEVRVFLYSETQAFVTHNNVTTGPGGQSLVIQELP